MFAARNAILTAVSKASKTVVIKVWGAGGGYGNYGSDGGENGGPGGYSTATFTVQEGTVLSIFVGQGGGNYQTNGDPRGGNAFSISGAGSAAGGKGGGFCGVFVGSKTWSGLSSIPTSDALIVAGSGGGASYYYGAFGGGYGGGTTGGAGMNRVDTASTDTDNGAGGTATAGGAGGSGPIANGTSGSLYTGGSNSGTCDAPAGGGGAGWYGGGGGGKRSSGAGQAGGGGGGSGMIASITSGTSLPTGVTAVTGNSFTTQTGTAVTAPNNSDGDYVSGRGVGGTSDPNANGGNGLIVISINGSKTSYSYTGDVQTLTV